MKKIISSIIILIVVLLTGVSISKSDSIKYNNTMNRLGMSDGAVVLKTHSKKSLVTAVKDLDKQKLSSYQIIFFDKDNSDFGYIYSHKKANKIPVTSGRYFSQSDFSSQIPFAFKEKILILKATSRRVRSTLKLANVMSQLLVISDSMVLIF
ncbi:hypothetical protein [Companilactobacillus nodensis]|uniref:hypothetical protein n=1 Tax=Companilactobacillus nodensis TaxID=460870 RepID=UPI000AF397B1|nr:hypothetical protein [Companilactobacillus nodensis]